MRFRGRDLAHAGGNPWVECTWPGSNAPSPASPLGAPCDRRRDKSLESRAGLLPMRLGSPEDTAVFGLGRLVKGGVAIGRSGETSHMSRDWQWLQIHRLHDDVD